MTKFISCMHIIISASFCWSKQVTGQSSFNWWRHSYFLSGEITNNLRSFLFYHIWELRTIESLLRKLLREVTINHYQLQGEGACTGLRHILLLGWRGQIFLNGGDPKIIVSVWGLIPQSKIRVSLPKREGMIAG